MSRHWADALDLSGLPRRIGGYRPAAVSWRAGELHGRLRSATREREKLAQRRDRLVAELDRLDVEELSGVVELSRHVAVEIVDEARVEYERTIERGRAEAARMRPEIPRDLVELTREVAELRASFDARRARFERALRTRLDDLAELDA